MPIQAPVSRKPLGYNLALDKIRTDQQVLLRRAEWLRAYQKPVNALVRKVEQALGTLRTDANDTVPESTINVYTHGYEDAYHFQVTVCLRYINGFADPAFQRLLEQFVDADVTKTQDYAVHMNREYRFVWKVEGTAHTLAVTIDAWVKSDSVTCRRVLKETRVVTREEPVYEMICEDLTQA